MYKNMKIRETLEIFLKITNLKYIKYLKSKKKWKKWKDSPLMLEFLVSKLQHSNLHMVKGAKYHTNQGNKSSTNTKKSTIRTGLGH